MSPMLQSQNIRSAGMPEFVLCTQGQTKERPACWEVPSFIIELSNCALAAEAHHQSIVTVKTM